MTPADTENKNSEKDQLDKLDKFINKVMGNKNSEKDQAVVCKKQLDKLTQLINKVTDKITDILNK